MRTLLLLALLLPPAALARNSETEVALLGAIHGGHRSSKGYSVEKVIETIRAYKPDVVFVEVPPHLFREVVERIDEKGFATRKRDLEDLAWIGAFPEIYRGVIPLRKEMGYAVVPVSGWRPEVSADRNAFWRGPGKNALMVDRRRIYDRVRAALREIQKREDWKNHPRFINSAHYRDLRQLERTLWAACFDEGLGRGGEEAINRAHYANIAAALDRHRGKRVLIVYGAAHHYWFHRELKKRAGVKLVEIGESLPR